MPCKFLWMLQVSGLVDGFLIMFWFPFHSHLIFDESTLQLFSTGRDFVKFLRDNNRVICRAIQQLVSFSMYWKLHFSLRPFAWSLQGMFIILPALLHSSNKCLSLEDLFTASSTIQRLLTKPSTRALESLFSWKIWRRLGCVQELKGYEEAKHLKAAFGTLLCWSYRRQQYFHQYY